MQYDFDEVIERRGTGALKYEALLPRWGRDDLIPLWVADMLSLIHILRIASWMNICWFRKE